MSKLIFTHVNPTFSVELQIGSNNLSQVPVFVTSCWFPYLRKSKIFFLHVSSFHPEKLTGIYNGKIWHLLSIRKLSKHLAQNNPGTFISLKIQNFSCGMKAQEIHIAKEVHNNRSLLYFFHSSWVLCIVLRFPPKCICILEYTWRIHVSLIWCNIKHRL